MEVLTRPELTDVIIERLRNAVFVYPTDTIYGIGCDATNEELVRRIRLLKQRGDAPFSVVVPTLSLVREHCFVPPRGEEWLDKLPGPYTLVLPVKKSFVARNVAPGRDSLGVRFLSNWFQEIVTELGVPVVTTSVNITGNAPMRSLTDVDDRILEGVDYVIDDGVLSGAPSTICLLTGSTPKIIERK